MLLLRVAPKFNRTIISHEDKNFIWNKFELLFSQIAGNADISVTYINFLAERISHPVVKAIMKFRSYPSVFKDKKNRMFFFFFESCICHFLNKYINRGKFPSILNSANISLFKK